MLHLLLPEDRQEVRHSICKSCEHFTDTPVKMCKNCRCVLAFKITLRSSHCPIHKWEEEWILSDKN
jgi:hypothetical protein